MKNRAMVKCARTAFLLSAVAFIPAQMFGDDRWDNNRGGHRGDCGLTIVGLTSDQTLVRLKQCEPRWPRSVKGISGLTGADTMLVGIDYRVQDGNLYGVGNGGGIYSINTSTGVATKARQLTAALNGTLFGVDFNPAADALRIVSNTGQNLRHPFADPAAMTAVDTPLNYTAGTPTAGISGAAYINNDLSADTGTFLFDIDAALNQLAIQLPPNNGTLTRIGALGVDADVSVGFDIYTDLQDGVARKNTGFAILTVGGAKALYEVNLLTGKAKRLGGVQDNLIDLTVPLD